jgi:hypothetical protein
MLSSSKGHAIVLQLRAAISRLKCCGGKSGCDAVTYADGKRTVRKESARVKQEVLLVCILQ